MEINFNLTTDDTCGILILDTTLYLPENESGNYYKKSEVYSLLIISDFNNDEIYNYSINTPLKNISIKNLKDGYLNVYYILLPNKQYYESHEKTKEINYVSDGEFIYKDNLIVDPLELININYEITNLLFSYESIFSSCQLKNCYILLAKNSLLGSNSRCSELDNNYHRNLLWVILNVITYLTEFLEFLEADNILKLFTDCYGICKSEYLESNKNECGCS